MVPIIIIRTKDMRNSTNIFLINLSIADLLVLLICTPTVLVELNTKPETWILGHEMCKTVPFVELTVAHASVLTILAISFERYYAICQPLKAGYVCTKTRAILICALAWSVAALFTSPILWMAEYKLMDYVDGSLVAVCLTQAIFTWTISYFLMITMVFFFLPLIILIVLYGIIARNLIWNRGRMIRLRPTKPEMSLKARKQVILMLGAVVISFFFCLIPFRLLTLWIMLSPNQSIADMGFERYYNLLYFSRIMLYLNSAINPILYNLMSTKFRKGFYQMICTTWMRILTSITCNHSDKNKTKRSEITTNATNTTNTSNTTSSTTGLTSQASSNILPSKHQIQCKGDDECPKCHLNSACAPNTELKAILHQDESNCTALKNEKSANEYSCFVVSNKDRTATAAVVLTVCPSQQLKQQSNLISNSRLITIKQINIDEEMECEEDQIITEK